MITQNATVSLPQDNFDLPSNFIGSFLLLFSEIRDLLSEFLFGLSSLCVVQGEAIKSFEIYNFMIAYNMKCQFKMFTV